MDESYRVGDDVTVLPSHLTIPGVGVLVANAFVLHAAEPVLVDTGLAMEADSFVDALRGAVDPADLRWIWLTHDDSDHTGALEAVMRLAPDARLVTHALGALRMSTWWPIPLDRVHAIVPGDRIEAGDRTLIALRPPTYDNPTSTGFFDESTSTFFCVDSFGAILSTYVSDLGDVAEDELVGGMVMWATFDSPWTHVSDRARFGEILEGVRRLGPERVLSGHLPAAVGRIEELLKVLASVPDADPFVPPDAAAFAEIARALRAPT